MAQVKVEINQIMNWLKQLPKNPSLGHFVANEAARGMNPYVPMFTGMLTASATVTPFTVTYNTPYAGYVYGGRRMHISKERHALATSKWDKAYLAAHGEELFKACEQYLRMRA